MAKKAGVRNFSLFASINEVPCQYPWLCFDEKCDVLVIGGGATGALCLYHLAKAGVDAILVSQRPIGFSSASGSTSILQYQNDTLLTDLSSQIGKTEAVNYYRDCEKALARLEEMAEKLEEFDFVRRDSFIYTSSPADVNKLHTEYLMRRHNGFNAAFLEKNEACEKFSFELQAGILSKDSAGELDGYKLSHVLADSAEINGARIYENTAIAEINHLENGEIEAVTAYGRAIRAKRVIMATGCSAASYLELDLVTKTTFCIATSAVRNFQGYNSRAIVKCLDKNVTLRTTIDNRLLISGLDCTLMNKDGFIGRSKLIGSERVVGRKLEELYQILSGMMIGIDDIETEYQYTADYLKTAHGMPICGELEAEKYPCIYFAVVSGVNGILQSELAAEKLSKEIIAKLS